MSQSSQEWSYLTKPPTSLLLPLIFAARVNIYPNVNTKTKPGNRPYQIFNIVTI